MAYEKTNWTSTTPINTTNLNKIEQGIHDNSSELELEFFDNKVTFNSTVGNIHFTKQGKIVNINYRGGKVAHTTGEVLFVLPEGYRPARNVYFFAVEGNAGSNQSMYIGTNGECKCDFEGTGRVIFHITFATELGVEK